MDTQKSFERLAALNFVSLSLLALVHAPKIIAHDAAVYFISICGQKK